MVDGVPVRDIAQTHGTPLFVYSRSTIEKNWQAFHTAFADTPHRICYAVKANSNLAVLSVMAKLGSSFDIVSGGELQRVLAAGVAADKVVFSGVGKTRHEMGLALEAGIACFNIESLAEAHRLAEVAQAHGVLAHAHLSVCGIDCHIGSQLTSIKPYEAAFERIFSLVDSLEASGIALSHVDVGGGQGIRYEQESPLNIQAWAEALKQARGNRSHELWMEPGRFIVGPAGVFVTQVEYLKANSEKRFAVVDGAMNDLIRPALYSAWQDIQAVENLPRDSHQYDVVGPVCESADFLGKDRALAIAQGDYLAVMTSGAYGFVMSSNYNTRPRAAEVMVSEGSAHVVRQRETVESLFALETTL